MNDALKDWLDAETENQPTADPVLIVFDAEPSVEARLRDRISASISEKQLSNFTSIRIDVRDSAPGSRFARYLTSGLSGVANAYIVISGTRGDVEFKHAVCGRARIGIFGGNSATMAEFALTNAIEESVAALQELVGDSHAYTKTAKTIRFICWTTTALIVLFTSLSLYRVYILHPEKPMPIHVARLLLFGGIAFSAIGPVMILALTEPLFAPRDWLLNQGHGRRWFVRAGMPDGQNVSLLRLICLVIVIAGFFVLSIPFGMIF